MKRSHWKNIFAAALALSLLLSAALFRQGRQSRTAWSPVRLAQRQLILDAGHGGEDGGAVSLTGVSESNINLAIVQKLDALLGLYGVSPVLLRTDDVSLHDPSADTLREKKVSDLHNRVDAVQGTENALLVSIHQNSFQNAAYHGAQVFYREEGESKQLADQIQTAIRERIDPENKRSAARIPDTVYLMGHITCPAVLVECGFLSNAQEEAKLRDEKYQLQIALCITSALLKNGGNDGIMD